LSGFATPGSYYIIRTVEQRRGSLVSVALKLIANDRFATTTIITKKLNQVMMNYLMYYLFKKRTFILLLSSIAVVQYSCN